MAVQRVAAAAVRQSERSGAADVLLGDLLGAVERGEDAGGAGADDVAAHPVDPELRAGGGDPQQLALRQPDGPQPRAGVGDALCQRALVVGPARAERRRVLLVGESAADDLGADRGVGGRPDVDAQGEAVQELRAQVALLDVHRPDEDEAGVVLGRHRLALHARDRGRGGVEQRVDEVVGQQVDLVDVEDPLVGAGQQPGLEGLLAGQRATQVKSAHEPVQGGAERQLDERGGALGGRGSGWHLAAGRALAGGEGERLALSRDHRREQRRQATHGGRLGRAALAAHEHTADLGGDRVDEQRLDQRLLADDRRQRIGRRAHAWLSSSSP